MIFTGVKSKEKYNLKNVKKLLFFHPLPLYNSRPFNPYPKRAYKIPQIL
jgi:hypothetical protein